jgi:hypothetical protein
MQNAFLAAVRSGMMLGDGHAAITFEVGDETVNLALPPLELTRLLTLCMGLSAEAARTAGAGEVQVLPVEDWEIGRTESNAVIIRLASEGGASLTYRLGRQQALGLRDGITKATAAPPRERVHAQPVQERAAPDLAELVELREQCRDHPAALQLVESCLALLAELDAANDEGRAVYHKNLLELASAARAHLKSLESPAAVAAERPSPAAC